jgi:hypothetical protein
MTEQTAIRVVCAEENLSPFAERGFRTVDKRRVLSTLAKNEVDPGAALSAARAAVEAVGGFVTNAERNAGLGGERSSWRYIYEVWMVPENVGASQAA